MAGCILFCYKNARQGFETWRYWWKKTGYCLLPAQERRRNSTFLALQLHLAVQCREMLKTCFLLNALKCMKTCMVQQIKNLLLKMIAPERDFRGFCNCKNYRLTALDCFVCWRQRCLVWSFWWCNACWAGSIAACDERWTDRGRTGRILCNVRSRIEIRKWCFWQDKGKDIAGERPVYLDAVLPGLEV